MWYKTCIFHELFVPWFILSLTFFNYDFNEGNRLPGGPFLLGSLFSVASVTSPLKQRFPSVDFPFPLYKLNVFIRLPFFIYPSWDFITHSPFLSNNITLQLNWMKGNDFQASTFLIFSFAFKVSLLKRFFLSSNVIYSLCVCMYWNSHMSFFLIQSNISRTITSLTCCILNLRVHFSTIYFTKNGILQFKLYYTESKIACKWLCIKGFK